MTLQWNFGSWAFPQTSTDPTTKLGDAFFAASLRSAGALAQLITRRLSVASESLPDFYQTWFAMPWSRCYTLNVDDLEIAVMRRYDVRKTLSSVSATSGRKEGVATHDSDELQVVHLNGLVGDQLSDLTFSPLDYGARLSRPDEWMMRALSDIITRPVVFVGTELDDPTLWQYLEYRRGKGQRGIRELRPGSILVSPQVNPARELLLREFNVDLVEMDAEQFAKDVLVSTRSAAVQGHAALRAKRQSDQRTHYPPLVSDLLANLQIGRTEYLLGQEPQWSDLVSGKTIERSCDSEIIATAEDILSGKLSECPLLLTGTAGSGKSTSLMRLALDLSAKGIATYWIDEKGELRCQPPQAVDHWR